MTEERITSGKSLLCDREHLSVSGKRPPSGNLFLIGFMGAGKSAAAACMHDLFGMEIVEMDALIEQREGMSIPKIFESRGESYFRDAETALLTELQGRTNAVISCGGGVPLREENVAAMRKSGRIVLLEASPETILERVKNDRGRPLLENNKTVSFIAGLMEKRREKYTAAADLTVQTDGRDIRSICLEIADRLS